MADLRAFGRQPSRAGDLGGEVAVAELGRSDTAATIAGGVTSRAGRRAPRRRPSGAPPPLPRHLRKTGIGWLVTRAELARVLDERSDGRLDLDPGS